MARQCSCLIRLGSRDLVSHVDGMTLNLVAVARQPQQPEHHSCMPKQNTGSPSVQRSWLAAPQKEQGFVRSNPLSPSKRCSEAAHFGNTRIG